MTITPRAECSVVEHSSAVRVMTEQRRVDLILTLTHALTSVKYRAGVEVKNTYYNT